MRYCIFIICALCMAYAEPGEWVLLGDKKVSRFGKGTIKAFKNTVGFSGVKLRNTGGRLRLISVVIHFSDKTRQKINFSLVRLRKNEETKFFNVDCQRRSISKVSVHYVTAILTKPPHLELWGWRNYKRIVKKKPRDFRQDPPRRPQYNPRDHVPRNRPYDNNDPQDTPYDNDPQDTPPYDNHDPRDHPQDQPPHSHPHDSHESTSQVHWEHLGSKKVSFRSEYETIIVGKDKGVFYDLQLQVQENEVFIESITVYFHNNQTHKVTLNQLIAINGTTEIPLDTPRFIDHVTFKYASNSRGRQALIHLRGIRGKKIVKMTKRAEQNWNLLGQTNVSQGEDLESVHIYGSERTVSKLRLNIRNNRVHIVDAIVYFSDDTHLKLPIRKTFQSGEASPAFEIGSKKVVKRIDFVYHTEGIDYSKQSGAVEVWGL